MSSEEKCECGKRLSAHHMMLECTKTPEVAELRRQYFTKLKEHKAHLSDPPTLRELLTPPAALPREEQRKFLRIVAEYALKLPFDI